MAGTDKERKALYEEYCDRIEVDFNLNRTLVSFQANKNEPFYGWFKYREGFSSQLVQYFITKYHPTPGHILDPFAGAGATLFSAKELGWRTTGIEVLPVGKFVIEARIAAESVDAKAFKQTHPDFWSTLNRSSRPVPKIKHIPITSGAFPEDTEIELNHYLNHCESITDENIQTLFRFAAFCILEGISFTRKDGQYLRWDYRANRSWGKTHFDKGKIYSFQEAIEQKLNQLSQDLNRTEPLELFPISDNESRKGEEPEIILGSSLEHLPTLSDSSFDLILTSPPYCNRYDYTRTYALELVFLGDDDESVKKLRQEMLSCTVENREKVRRLKTIYGQFGKDENFTQVMSAYDSCEAMREVNSVLEDLNRRRKLNNSNIPRMVRNYFLEMCFIIFEMQRILKRRGLVVMVNDNVRYGGEEIPVDLILSDFAARFGFAVRKIWTLPTGKGNSSQQMGSHGKTELRKCVYVWEKP